MFKGTMSCFHCKIRMAHLVFGGFPLSDERSHLQLSELGGMKMINLPTPGLSDRGLTTQRNRLGPRFDVVK